MRTEEEGLPIAHVTSGIAEYMGQMICGSDHAVRKFQGHNIGIPALRIEQIKNVAVLFERKVLARYSEPCLKTKTMSFKSSSSILLVSIATGVAIGMLLAPASGKKTRKAIVNTKDDLHYLTLKAGDLVGSLREKVAEMRSGHSESEA